MFEAVEDITVVDFHKNYCTLMEHHKKLQVDFDNQSQLIYDYKRELCRLKTLETEYIEIESLQSGDRKECEKAKLRIQELEEQKNYLKESYEQQIEYFERDSIRKDEELSKLQEELKLLSFNISNSDKSVENDLRFKNIELKDTVTQLINEIITLNEKIESLQTEQLSLHEENNALKNHVETLNETFNCKQFEINEAKVLIDTLQEDLLLTKTELEAAKTKPLQDGSQGNSLFSEVDDKRIELQDRMNVMKAQYLEMKQESGKLLSQIATLSCRNSMLCQRWETEIQDRKDDDDRVNESHKSRIEFLESQIETYKNEISIRQKINATNLDSGEIEFMENLLESKSKEMEKLKQESNTLSLSRMILSRQLRDSNIEMRNWRAKTAKLESEIMKLQAEMETLKLKKNNEGDSNTRLSYCGMCLRNKKSLSQSSAARPKLKDLEESLDRASHAIEDRFSIDYSRQIKRSLLKEQNQSERKESFNDISENNKENIARNEESQSSNNVQKKVQFADGTVDNSNIHRNKPRKGGKVILCKPMVLKKKF